MKTNVFQSSVCFGFSERPVSSWLAPTEFEGDYADMYTAISRKVVGKSARDNPERYCGWFWARCSSKKFERMPREAMDVYLRVLKESNKRSFDSYSVWNSVLIISHIPFGIVACTFLPTTFLEIAVCSISNRAIKPVDKSDSLTVKTQTKITHFDPSILPF